MKEFAAFVTFESVRRVELRIEQFLTSVKKDEMDYAISILNDLHADEDLFELILEFVEENNPELSLISMRSVRHLNKLQIKGFKMNKQELESELKSFYGSDTFYLHPLVRDVKYTSGVKFFAENAGGGAYWLLDILLTEPAIHKQAREFAAITLTVSKDETADIVVTNGRGPEDGGEKIGFTRKIEFTDCPEGIWKFYFIGNILLLPSEY